MPLIRHFIFVFCLSVIVTGFVAWSLGLKADEKAALAKVLSRFKKKLKKEYE